MMNRAKMLLLTTLFLFTAILVSLYYFYLDFTTPLVNPPSPGETVISIGENVTIHKDEHVHIKNSLITFQIKQFINSPCPTDANCIWSGQKVVFQFVKNDQPIEDRDHLYVIRTINSDYSTYAIVQVNTIFDTCDNVKTESECAMNVATRYASDPSCNNVVGVINKQYCADLVALGKRYSTNDKKYCVQIVDKTRKARCEQ